MKKLFLYGMFFLFVSCASKNEMSDKNGKPNVLLILTDQQNAKTMSAAANKNLKTPAMDKLAQEGVMFTKAYCTSPVCGPARSSIVTGRMPHETGVEWNGDQIKEDIQNAGEIFRAEGYRTVWAGKWHLPESYPQRAKSKQKEIKGFEMLQFRDANIDNWMLGSETDPPLTNAVLDFFNHHDDSQPFFLAVNYHNPHDICFYARKDGWASEGDSLLEIRYYGFEYKLPEVVSNHPSNYTDLPVLPDNHELSIEEPGFITDKRNHHKEYGLETHLAFNEFGELEWKGYLNAYYRLTEMVDAEIEQVLSALEVNGYSDNTIIVFSSDHGDGAAAHKWAAKLSLFEESSNIPFIICYKNQIPSAIVDDRHLVSQIDILPTLCDYAGIEEHPKFTGKSLRPLFERETPEWRDFLIVELADFKPDRNRKGRMVRTVDYKYNLYSSGEHNEQFFNMNTDPGEMINLADQQEYDAEIERHRSLLQAWKNRTNDPFPY